MVGRLTAALRGMLRDPALRQALAIVLGLRLALGLVAWASIILYPITGVGGDHLELLTPEHSRLWPWIGPWQRWDALWYEHIARSGYGGHGDPDAAFFPLYPGTVHLLTPLTGGNAALTGLLVSTVALAAGLVLLHRLVAAGRDRGTADRAMLYLAASPLGFFLLAGFTESLFLLLATGCLLAARGRRMVVAGVLAGLAALCRPTGVLLLAPLLVETLVEARRRRCEGLAWLRPAHLALLLPVLCLAGWDLWVRVRLGASGGVASLQKEVWGNHVVMPWTALHDSLRTVLDGGHPEELLNLCASLALVISVPLMWGRLPAAQAAYATVSILPIVCRESLVTPQESSARYLLTVFPVFVLLALAGRRAWVDRLVLVTFPVLLGALMIDFTHFGFLG